MGACRATQAAIWDREDMSSLVRMWLMWLVTVERLRNRRAAMAELLSPWATSWATSSSREESSPSRAPISGCSYAQGPEDSLGAFDAAGGTDGVERVAGGDGLFGVAEQLGAPAADEGVEPGPGCGSCQLLGMAGGGVGGLDPEPRRGEGGQEEPIGLTVRAPAEIDDTVGLVSSVEADERVHMEWEHDGAGFQPEVGRRQRGVHGAGQFGDRVLPLTVFPRQPAPCTAIARPPLRRGGGLCVG